MSAQLVQVSHFSGAAAIGTRTVSVSSTGGVSTILVACPGAPTQYHIGTPTGTGGSYNYSITAPIYKIRIVAHGLNAGPSGMGEYMSMTVNGSPYPLTATDIVSYNSCSSTGAAPSYLLSGRLYGPIDAAFSWSHHNAGIIEMSSCTGINSFSIYCNGVGNGASYHVFVDTTAPPGCTLIATNNGPLCAGDTLKLFASGPVGGSYSWTGPAGFTSPNQNPVIPGATPANSGTYTVVHTSGSTTLTATTTVVINPTPVITAGNNSPVCAGDTLQLTGSPFIAGVSYSWTGPGGFSSLLQNPQINPATTGSAGTYTVIANAGSCRDTATTVVVISPPIAVTATNNGPLCAGDELLLTATALTGATFQWTGPAGFTSTSATPAISPTTIAHSGTYTVTATLGGCNNSAVTTVVIIPRPEVTASWNNPLCEGDTLRLTCISSLTGTAFSWTGPGSFASMIQNPVVSGITTAGAGTYSVIAGTEGCLDTAFVAVVITPLPIVIALAQEVLCAGSDLRLTASPAEVGKTFSWAGPGGYWSTLQNPVIWGLTANGAGVYTVTAAQNGCSRSANVVVEVVSVVQHLRDTMLCLDKNPTVLLLAVAPQEASILWSTGETGSTISIRDTGMYWVSVQVDGCVDKDSVNIRGEICDCDLVLPNAFTPNGDGDNDHFRPIMPDGCVVSAYEFFIFNRWGERVFFSTDEHAKWDGTFRGERGDVGVYMYYLNYSAGKDKKQKMLKGDVTLVR